MNFIRAHVCLLIGVTLAFTACAIVSTGHKVPVEKTNSFKPGVTTKEEVLAVLGAPENITENTADQTTVLSYYWVTDRFLGIGLPPFFAMGRKADGGFQLSIAFVAGTYKGHTLTTLDQRLFMRRRAITPSAGNP